MIRIKPASITVLLFMLVSCSTNRQTISSFRLFGMLYDDYNQPVSDAVVDINGMRHISDNDGRFLFNSIEGGTCSVIITADGFLTKIFSIDLEKPDQVLYVKLTSLIYIKESIETYLLNKDYENAESFITQGLTINPKDPVLLYWKAVSLYLKGNPREALEILQFMLNSGYAYREISLFILAINENFPEIPNEY